MQEASDWHPRATRAGGTRGDPDLEGRLAIEAESEPPQRQMQRPDHAVHVTHAVQTRPALV